MKTHPILILTLVLLNLPATFAAEPIPTPDSSAVSTQTSSNCALKQENLKGIIKKKSTLLNNHLGIKPDSSNVGITETAVLTNKAKVIYHTGGCAQASSTITYRNVKPTNQTTAAFVQLALKMLNETPFASEAREPAIFERALKNVGDSPKNLDKGQIELSCGNASCSLDFREKTSLILSYDQAP